MKLICSLLETNDERRVDIFLRLSKAKQRQLATLAQQKGVSPEVFARDLLEAAIKDGLALQCIKERLMREAVLSA